TQPNNQLDHGSDDKDVDERDRGVPRGGSVGWLAPCSEGPPRRSRGATSLGQAQSQHGPSGRGHARVTIVLGELAVASVNGDVRRKSDCAAAAKLEMLEFDQQTSGSAGAELMA